MFLLPSIRNWHVYPTNVHAFDMLYPEQELAKQANEKLLERVGIALAQKL